MFKKIITVGMMTLASFGAGKIYGRVSMSLDKNIAKVETALKDEKLRDDILKKLLKPEIIGYGNRILVDNLEEGLIKNAPNSDLYFQRLMVAGVRSGYSIERFTGYQNNSNQNNKKFDNIVNKIIESLDELVD